MIYGEDGLQVGIGRQPKAWDRDQHTHHRDRAARDGDRGGRRLRGDAVPGTHSDLTQASDGDDGSPLMVPGCRRRTACWARWRPPGQLVRPRLLRAAHRLRLRPHRNPARRRPPDAPLRHPRHLPQPGQRPDRHGSRRRSRPVRRRAPVGPDRRALSLPRALLHGLDPLALPV